MSGFGGEGSKSDSGNVSSNRGESNSSKEEAEGSKQQRSKLDAEIQKGDIKMRAALDSAYLSVSDSGNDNNDDEETKDVPS